ncbi:hypothetical protein [Streptomyces sp. NPDC003023]|uniref:hypothetical protein n=1 Tax=Streptomyces sp. NPDC003023 TaxID=3364675 RepID=UPI0036B8A260
MSSDAGLIGGASPASDPPCTFTFENGLPPDNQWKWVKNCEAEAFTAEQEVGGSRHRDAHFTRADDELGPRPFSRPTRGAIIKQF